MKHKKSTIAKLLTKSNAVMLASVTAICFLFPVIAFSQGFRFVSSAGRSQSQSSTNSGQIAQEFTVSNLNVGGADKLRQAILAGSRMTSLQTSAGAADIAAAQRGNPFINFENAKPLAADGGNLANAAPLALASADFDADGTPDLAVAYAGENGGFVLIRRGNIESIFPSSADVNTAPFFAESSRFEILLAADYLSAGDFNGDGRADLLVVKSGSNVLIFLAGAGDGNFAAPQAIHLKGVVTAFTVGEVNNFDNLPDVAVGILEKGAAKVLIFQNRNGAFGGKPEIVKVSKSVSALAFGALDAKTPRDLVAAAGDKMVLVSGQVKTDAEEKSSEIEKSRITRRKLDFQATNLAVGDFSGGNENEIAVLSKDGALKILSPDAERIRLISSIQTLPEGGTRTFLLPAKVSTRKKMDLIVGGNYQLNLAASDDANNLSLAASFDANDAPVAVLPMRLNKDALADLVVITKNNSTPTILMTAPMSVITVNSTSPIHTVGSINLEQAIHAANNNPGLDEIRFNVPDPNAPIMIESDLPEISEAATFDATTQAGYSGEPLIEISAAPSVEFTVPMLRFTNAGNGVLRGFVVTTNNYLLDIIQLDGNNNFIEGNFIGTNRAGTASGNTIGGATPQARNVISGVAGAPSSTGVSVTGNNNRIEGNYIGTDKTGMSAIPNGGGVYVGSIGDGNIEGNIISGNGASGIKSVSQPSATRFLQIADNLIGVDASGANNLGNSSDGINLEFNGTAPTSIEPSKIWNNVISGNNGDGVRLFSNANFNRNNASPQAGVFFLVDIAARRNNFNAALPVAPTGNKIGTNADGATGIGKFRQRRFAHKCSDKNWRRRFVGRQYNRQQRRNRNRRFQRRGKLDSIKRDLFKRAAQH